MTKCYSRLSNSSYILPQNCIRYDLRRHKIPNFPGGACPRPLVGVLLVLRALYFRVPASQYPTVVQLDHFKSGGYGPVPVHVQ